MGVQEGGVYRIGPRTALRSAAAVLFGVLLGGVSSLDAQTIPKTGWSLLYVDSQELVAENGAATNAFDGNTATIWHTKWSPTADPLPHEIQIDLGATYLVSAFRYRPRSNSANGRIRDWEFYVATSPGAWGAPVATGTFANSSTEKEVTFAAVTARYVRLRALSEVNGNPWTCVAELSLLGTPAETTTTTSTTTSTTAAPTTTTTSSTTTTTLAASLIPKAGWSLVYVDSQELVAENGAATNAFDGNTATIWHTKWSPTADPLPHEIQIDLGATYLVSAFRYRPRSSPSNGRIRDWEFYVATTPGAWGAPVATGTFANSSTEKEVTFAAVTARYVRLRALSEVNGNPWTCVAELSLLGTPAETTTTTSTTTSTTAAPTTTTTSSTTTTTLAASLIPKTGWSLVYVDSQELVAENGAATNAFDGNTATIWHTKWSPTADPLPHEIQIDLGATYLVSAFRYRPRSNSANGRIRDWEFYVATTPGAWGAPVATGTFANSSTEKEVAFAAVTARYVRLRALSEVNGNPWTSMAELSLLGTPAETTTTTSTTTVSTTSTTLPPGSPNKALWRRWFVDSEELAAGNHPATAAFDANPATYWRSEFSVYNATHPHELQLNLGGLYTLTGFRYLPPQDGSTAGRINGFALYTSLDGTAWGSPVATGTLANSAAEQSVAFAPTVAQYVRLVSQSGHNADRSAAIAELTLLGTCVVPSVALVHPQRYDLTPTADLGVLVNTCYDPVLHAGWGVQLTLDTTTVRPLFTAPFSTTFSGLLPGEHTLEAMALDATATPVPGPDTQELVTAAATGGRYLVAVGDSITYGIGDNVPTDDTSPDGRDRSRGYPPILNGLLTTATGGLPHTVANEGVPGAKTSWGATVLPNLLAKHASAERVLVLLGTNDSNVFAPVPSGLGLNPGDPGYPGTVKANLQAALDAINAAGKNPVLLKLPPALARCSTCAPYPDPDQGDKNVNFIKPYNQVIDELVANPANNVTIPPPNLYAYFLARPELYADFLHPTGVGYQHLARLVCQALTQTPCDGS